MKEVEFKDIKVGDYIYVYSKNTDELLYLDIVKEINRKYMIIDFIICVEGLNFDFKNGVGKYKYNLESEKGHTTYKFLKLNKKEKEKMKMKVIESQI